MPPRDYRDFLADIVAACRSLIRFVEGMTLEEIAEALSISLATVKRSLRGASERLSSLVDADATLRKPGTKAGRGSKK